MKAPTEKRIRSELTRIREKLKAGDDSEIVYWVVPNVLGCSQRPLRDLPPFGGRSPLPAAARPLVVLWVDRIEEMGFRSIICLLEDAQLDRYYIRGGIDLHEGGLLGYYASRGFDVRHRSLTDYQRPSQIAIEEVFGWFKEMEKPVLIHCSASIDRTTPVAGFIAKRWNNDEAG